MPVLVYGDRVQETFTTTGTGPVSLAGPVVGYQSFANVLADTNTCYYTATDGTNWETGLATYATSGNTLTRTTVYESSNGNAAVAWAAGVKNIWLDLPAAAIASFGIGTLAVGSTGISGGATGKILYDDAGALGEKAVTGTGDVVLGLGATITSPVLIGPELGTPVSGDLSNCTGIQIGQMTALGVGSVILAICNTNITAGGTITAGSLTPAQGNSSAFNSNPTSSGPIPVFSDSGDVLTGTWRALQSLSPSNGTTNNVGLFQRIA